MHIFKFKAILIPMLWIGLIACSAGEQSTDQDKKTGLAGQVISASDVSGQPDLPLADQLVLAVKLEQAAALLGVTGDQLSNNQLRFLKAQISKPEPTIVYTKSGNDGSYSLTLPPGEYVICLADPGRLGQDFPTTTRGCGLSTARQGEIRNVDISSGFGEIVLVEKK